MRETLRRIQSKADGPRVSQASHARQPRQAGNRRSGVETRQTRQPPRDAGRPAWPAWARRAIFTPGGRDRLAEHPIQGFSQFPGAPGATGAASPRAGYSGRGSFLTQGRRGRAGLPTAALASLDGHGEPGRRTRRASVTPRAAGSGDAVAGRAGAPKRAPVCRRRWQPPPHFFRGELAVGKGEEGEGGGAVGRPRDVGRGQRLPRRAADGAEGERVGRARFVDDTFGKSRRARAGRRGPATRGSRLRLRAGRQVLRSRDHAGELRPRAGPRCGGDGR